MINEFLKSLWAMKSIFLIGLIALAGITYAEVFQFKPLNRLGFEVGCAIIAGAAFLFATFMSFYMTSENMYVKRYAFLRKIKD